MYKLTFPSSPSMTFNTLDEAANFMCSIFYGFISCIDENGDDNSIKLCQLISKKLRNKKESPNLKRISNERFN